MRKAKLFSHDAIVPRMSWSAHNLYNLIARSTVPFHVAGTDFSRTALTMYQQRWRAKRFIRGYHGDWIPERRFKRWFLPVDLPKLASSLSSAAGSSQTSAMHLPPSSSSSRRPGAREADSDRSQMPTASLFMSEVERRLDVIVFRCCFARSVYEARSMVVHGKVKLNGVKMSDPNRLLSPGDLISVDPAAIPMLSQVLRQRAARRERLKKKKAGGGGKGGEASASKSDEQKDTAEDAAVQEGETVAAEEGKSTADGEKPEGSSAEQSAEAAKKEGDKKADKGKGKEKEQEAKRLPHGVRPFTLPAFAAPFLFVPSYIEPSFTTCSAIYLRHPTIVPASRSSASSSSSYGNGGSGNVPEFLSEIPSPYPASGDIFSMAWEHYARTAPRVRGDLRRLQLKARVGPSRKEPGRIGGLGGGGMEQERAKIVWRRMRAVRKGWTREPVGAGAGAASRAADARRA
ncbi:hypothetical protein OC844_003434 [Tilletia horrida]|nr:hypothetical protein OC844_003434 [Tilletia horrida]